MTTDAVSEKLRCNAARLSRVVAIWLLLVTPLISPLIRKIGPLSLHLGAATCALAFYGGLKRKPLTAHFKVGLATIVLLLSWSWASLSWSPYPTRGATSLLGSTAIVMSGAILLLTPFPQDRKRLLAAIGISVGSSIIAADLLTGGHLVKLLYSRGLPDRFNMIVVTLLLLSLALAPRVHRLKSDAKFLVAFIPLSAATFVSDSETAKVALVVGLAAYLFALVVPRFLSAALFVAGMLLFCAFPNWILMAAQGLEGVLPSRIWVEGSAADRLHIWDSFWAMSQAGFPIGWGVDATALAKNTPFFLAAPESQRPYLLNFHPHNNALQIAAELGRPGQALTFLFSLVFIDSIRRRPDLYPALYAFAACVICIAFISHGLWQEWWWAAIVVGRWAIEDDGVRA